MCCMCCRSSRERNDKKKKSSESFPKLFFSMGGGGGWFESEEFVNFLFLLFVLCKIDQGKEIGVDIKKKGVGQ